MVERMHKYATEIQPHQKLIMRRSSSSIFYMGTLLLVIQHLILTQLCFPMHSFFIELRNETQIPQNFWFYYSYMGARGYNQEGLQDDAS